MDAEITAAVVIRIPTWKTFMSHAVAVLATLILTFVWSVQLETDIRKDYAKTGYIIIDRQAYRLVPVER